MKKSFALAQVWNMCCTLFTLHYSHISAVLDRNLCTSSLMLSTSYLCSSALPNSVTKPCYHYSRFNVCYNLFGCLLQLLVAAHLFKKWHFVTHCCREVMSWGKPQRFLNIKSTINSWVPACEMWIIGIFCVQCFGRCHIVKSPNDLVFISAKA